MLFCASSATATSATTVSAFRAAITDCVGLIKFDPNTAYDYSAYSSTPPVNVSLYQSGSGRRLQSAMSSHNLPETLGRATVNITYQGTVIAKRIFYMTFGGDACMNDMSNRQCDQIDGVYTRPEPDYSGASGTMNGWRNVSDSRIIAVVGRR